VPDPAEAAARDEAMAAAYEGGTSDAPGLPGIASGIVHAGTPLAGELFPQGIVDGQLFDDVYGTGWRLVTLEPNARNALDDALLEWFATIGGEVIDDAGRAENLATWCAAHDVRWALQRPDFYLFGVARDRSGAEALLADARRQLVLAAPAAE
jgi:hypothetical protein